jgi:hypothetical protein
MTIVIFVGPTLRPEEVAATFDAICLPPVAQGDVYRAARDRPRAIGIIDGYFSGAPSVWHKEILWAMLQGVHVFGSASMGALRAAELYPFGMRGIGRIFEAFRDGTLEDDDEVAIVHGPAEIGYVAASEPMVNIRETLARAEAVGVVSAATRAALVSLGKSQFFADRSWSALLDGAGAQGVGEPELSSLRDWLPDGRVDQKRADALEMLEAMRETLASPEPASPEYQFEWTHLWDEFVFRSQAGPTDLSPSTQLVIDELRIEGPESYGRVEARALLRLIAATGVGRPPAISPDDLRATLTATRATLGLSVRADLDRWMSQNDLDEISLERLLKNEAAAKALRNRVGHEMEPCLVDELRLSGDYARLSERARNKQEAVAATAQADNRGPSPGIKRAALRLWFFETLLHRSMPDDIEEIVKQLGFADVAALDAALHREWLYREARHRDDSPPL